MSVTLFASTMPFMSLISTSLSSIHPPLCHFGGGVQLARQISFQLVLVQILILKGGLNKARLRKDEWKKPEGRKESILLLVDWCFPLVVYLAINVLDCPMNSRKKSSM